MLLQITNIAVEILVGNHRPETANGEKVWLLQALLVVWLSNLAVSNTFLAHCAV